MNLDAPALRRPPCEQRSDRGDFRRRRPPDYVAVSRLHELGVGRVEQAELGGGHHRRGELPRRQASLERRHDGGDLRRARRAAELDPVDGCREGCVLFGRV